MKITNDNSDLIVHSSVYGDLKPEKHQLFEFVKGMVGFQALRNYMLLPYEDTPFFILHGCDEEVAFILLPGDLVTSYTFDVDQSTLELLEIKRPEEVVTMLVANIRGNEISVNLRAPVLLAPESQKGCQYILHNNDLPLRYVLREGGDLSARS